MKPYGLYQFIAADQPPVLLDEVAQHRKGFWTKTNLPRPEPETFVVTI
jgi:hypothetical protein